jgi:uncharacterized repeat protein (TIGR01451 family)
LTNRVTSTRGSNIPFIAPLLLKLTLLCGSDDDVANAVPSHDHILRVDGGPPSSSDTLIVDALGLPVVTGPGAITVSGHKLIEHLNFETVLIVNSDADLEIMKTDAPDPIEAGSNLVYTLTVTNHGPLAAGDVTLIDPLPFGVTYVSTEPPGLCVITGNFLSCDLGMLAENSAVSVTVVVQTALSLSLTNEATVTSTTPDSDSINNSDTIDTTVFAAADDDGDLMPNWWEILNGLQPTVSNAPTFDTDGDGAPDLAEYIADTDPKDPGDYLKIDTIQVDSPISIGFETSPVRLYDVEVTTNPVIEFSWTNFQAGIQGDGTKMSISDTNNVPSGDYRLKAGVP